MVKKVMTNYYVHKSNVNELLDIVEKTDPMAANCIKTLYQMIHTSYEIIKYDIKKCKLSFIESPDFDSSNEPIVGDSLIYDLITGEHKLQKGRKKNFQIYHHKWSFVADDYTGFDIEESKRRSELWQSIPEIVANKSRIGNQDFWFALLDKYNIEH